MPAFVEHLERAENAVVHRLPSAGSTADRSTTDTLQPIGCAPTPPPPPPPPPPPGPCADSYPSVCIPPPPPDLNCPDIPYTNFTVRWDVAVPDPHHFDGNKDGVGCES
jgi:hypothetical protein